MGKRKQSSARQYLIDLYQMRIRVGPLFGLSRLVKLSHRKRNGVLYCDNVMCSSEAITFSEKNARSDLFTMSHTSPNHAGVHAEPRLNVPNEASEADRQRFLDDGTGVVFSFTPQAGRTFSMDSEMYKTYDAGHRYTRGLLPDDARIARWELTLDVSAYLQAGYSDTGESPRCEFESLGTKDKRGRTVRAPARSLIAAEQGAGLWKWHVDDVRAGGIYRLAWELVSRDPSRASKLVNLEKLATALSVDTSIAKDLHNFVSICHYYAADYRSLNTIARKMITHRVVLFRSLDSLERLIGAQLFERMRGKGLLRITAAGEAVLDWWSQFYMRWTFIAPDPVGTK